MDVIKEVGQVAASILFFFFIISSYVFVVSTWLKAISHMLMLGRQERTLSVN